MLEVLHLYCHIAKASSVFFLLFQVCEQACASLCVLALRKPNNCKVIMDCGGALAALQAMKTHPDEVNVQVTA